MRRSVRNSPPECPKKDLHTPSPEGYVHWHDWAEYMSKTHRQIRCPGCGLLAIWVPDGRKGKRDQTTARSR